MYGGPLAVPGWVVVDIPETTTKIDLEYIASYGNMPDDVPQRIRDAIKSDVLSRYNRQYTKEDEAFARRLVETFFVREFK